MEIVCILILPGATFLLIWVYRYQGDEKNTHSTASGMSGQCQVIYRVSRDLSGGRLRKLPGLPQITRAENYPGLQITNQIKNSILK